MSEEKNRYDDIDLEYVRANAWTFDSLEPPAGAVLLGARRVGDDTYYYYTNPENDIEKPYLFETESGYRMKRKMAKVETKKW